MGPKQSAPSKPAKKAPADVEIGGVFGYPATFLGPTPAQKALAKLKAAQKLKAKNDAAINDKIFAARQSLATKSAINSRVGAQAGLLPAGTKTPFGGGTGAKDSRFVEDKTTKVQLAKSRQAQLAQGGLLDAQQHLREALAMLHTSQSRALRMSDKDQLPADLTVLQPGKIKPTRHLESALPPTGAKPSTYEAPSKPQARGGIYGAPLAPMPKISDNLERAGRSALGKIPLVPGGLTIDQADQIGKGVQHLTGKLAVTKQITNKNVPHFDVTDLLTPEAKAKSNGKRVHLDELLTNSQKYGDFALGGDARAELVHMAKLNGYHIQDAPEWNDALLAQYAFNKNEKSVTGFLRNFASDVGSQAALASAPLMVGDAIEQSIAHRSLVPVAKLGEGLAAGVIKVAPFIGDRPWLENLYEKPFTTAATVLPAGKFLGLKLGKGLGAAGVDAFKGTRDITLPTRAAAERAGLAPEGSGVLKDVPTSQHPVTRLAVALHDRVLAMGEHPDERTKRQQITAAAKNPVGETVNQVKNLPSKLGHKLEGKIERGLLNDKHMAARLRGGHESFLAHQALLESYRKLPWVQDLLKKGWGGKEHSIEDLFYHEGASVPPEQMAAMYREFARRTEEDAGRLEQLSAEAAVSAEIAKGHGDEAGATDFLNQQKKYDKELHDIRRPGGIIETQLKAAERSDASKHVIGGGGEDVQRAVDAMRHASKSSGDILQQQGLIDEKGRLWGDWQYKIAAIDATEGPGSHLGGETGTPAYHIVQKLLPARQEFMDARADYHGVAPDEAAGLAASKDVHSPEAKHQLRRWAVLSEMMSGLASRHVDDQLRAGRLEGHSNATLDRAAAAARHALEDGRSWHQRQPWYRKLVNAHEHLTSTEKAAANAKATSLVRRREADLEAAKATRQSQERIREMERLLKEAVDSAEVTFKPSKDLLNVRLQIERADMKGSLNELPDKVIDAIVNSEFRQKLSGQQRDYAREYIRNELAKEHPLGAPHGDLESRIADAAQRFKEASGGKTVQQAARMRLAGAHYQRALEALREDQAVQGHDPFHMHMHKPESEYNLQPVRVSSGKQWEEADYTHDMHFLVARDLEGLSRKKVEGEMFKSLEEEPIFIGNPPAGSTTPPGFINIPRELWDNLQKVAKDPEQVKGLQDELAAANKTSHEGTLIQGDEHVLISRHLSEWLQAELKRDNGAGISGALELTNMYRRYMLFSLPRTYVNNAVGNPVIAMVMGARMRHFFEARRLLKEHPERLPNTLRKRGTSANIMQGGKKMTGWQQMWRSMNTFQEDLGNMMVYLKHAEKSYRTVNGVKMMRRIDKSSSQYISFLEDAAMGKNPDAAAWGKKAAEAFGDMYRTLKHDNTLATAFLFHRWVGHMIALTMYTLPLKYPGRNLFLVQTAQLADQYRKEHGVFPDWAAGMIPLWSTMEKAGGLPQSVTWALGGGGINPFATAGQTFDLGSPDQPKAPLQAAIASNINPGIRVLAEFLSAHRLDTLQPFKDWHGNDITGLNANVLAQGIIANLPVVNTIFPRAGLSDDTIQIPTPWTPQHPRWTRASSNDPSYASPQTMGHGLLLDWAARIAAAAGAPVRPVDAAGERTNLSAEKTIAWQQKQLSTRETQTAKEQELANIKLFHDDREAWNKKFGVKP